MPETNIETLCFGIKTIAENHGWRYDVDYQENGEVCIIGGTNVPTLCDVRMLCQDVGLNTTCIESHEYGIDVWLDELWLMEQAELPCVCCNNFWKNIRVNID